MPGEGGKGKRECWVHLSERAEAGGHTDLVLTQLWKGPCSKRDTEPNSSYPGPGAADSPAPRNTRVCVQGGGASSHLHHGLRAAEDAVLSTSVQPCGTHPTGYALVALTVTCLSLLQA